MKKPQLFALVFAAAFTLGVGIVALMPHPVLASEVCDYYHPEGTLSCWPMPPQECSCGPGYLPGMYYWCCEGWNYDENGDLTIPCSCFQKCVCEKAHNPKGKRPAIPTDPNP